MSNQEAALHAAEAVHASCTPREFEALVATMFEEDGYRAEQMPKGSDQGIDLLAKEGGYTTAVQVKRFDPDSSKVGSPVVRETIGSAEAHGADVAAIVTTSLFTSPAIDIANEQNEGRVDVELISGPDMINRLNRPPVVETHNDRIAS